MNVFKYLLSSWFLPRDVYAYSVDYAVTRCL